MVRVRFRGEAARSLSYGPLDQSNLWLPTKHIEEAERWFFYCVLAARLLETDPAARFSALEMKLALLGN